MFILIVTLLIMLSSPCNNQPNSTLQVWSNSVDSHYLKLCYLKVIVDENLFQNWLSFLLYIYSFHFNTFISNYCYHRVNIMDPWTQNNQEPIVIIKYNILYNSWLPKYYPNSGLLPQKGIYFMMSDWITLKKKLWNQFCDLLKDFIT